MCGLLNQKLKEYEVCMTVDCCYNVVTYEKDKKQKAWISEVAHEVTEVLEQFHNEKKGAEIVSTFPEKKTIVLFLILPYFKN